MKIVVDQVSGKVKGYVPDNYFGPDHTVNPPEGFNPSTDPNKIYYDIQSGLVKNKIPTSVTMRQARLALRQAGLLSTIQTYIDNIADVNTREIAKIEWEYSQTVNRDFHLVQSLKSTLNLTESQLDDLFILADTL